MRPPLLIQANVGFWRAIASSWGVVVEKLGVVVEATAVDTVGAVESVY
jgi:hypothetical protein